VANNTLVNSDIGILISGREDLGATWSGVVANNIVAGASNWGVTIHDPFAAVVNENNLVFGATNNFFTPGPGTLFVDPQFIGGGDFRLNFGSPAINAGNSARVPPDITRDLSGLLRIQGAAVDMGAYETVPEPSALMILLPAILAIANLRQRNSDALVSRLLIARRRWRPSANRWVDDAFHPNHPRSQPEKTDEFSTLNIMCRITAEH
jgi:hypothetical protein